MPLYRACRASLICRFRFAPCAHFRRCPLYFIFSFLPLSFFRRRWNVRVRLRLMPPRYSSPAALMIFAAAASFADAISRVMFFAAYHAAGFLLLIFRLRFADAASYLC